MRAAERKSAATKNQHGLHVPEYKASKGETATIYLLVEVKYLYCMSSADIEQRLSEIFSQILKTDTSSNCACRSLCDLQASYPASHTSTSHRHPDIHKHHRGKTRLLTATAVHRNDDNEKKQQLWKNTNLENA